MSFHSIFLIAPLQFLPNELHLAIATEYLTVTTRIAGQPESDGSPAMETTFAWEAGPGFPSYFEGDPVRVSLFASNEPTTIPSHEAGFVETRFFVKITDTSAMHRSVREELAQLLNVDLQRHDYFFM